MSEAEPAARGWQVLDVAGRRIGTVDDVFADYLLVRTRGWLPVDLYVPVTEVSTAGQPQAVVVAAQNDRDAYARWHRPLKKAPHD
ncbi:MAG: PRC-barrel domain-containing protein [Chloroflexota bacterium]|nr:PRC-barrel domain-containing protein [Chloroflexota bacterium]